MDLELAEAAEERAERGGDGNAVPELEVREHTAEVQLLLRVVALLQSANQQRSEKRIPYPPLPRLRTARRIVRDRRRRAMHGRLADLVARAQERWVAEQAAGTAPGGPSADELVDHT